MNWYMYDEAARHCMDGCRPVSWARWRQSFTGVLALTIDRTESSCGAMETGRSWRCGQSLSRMAGSRARFIIIIIIITKILPVSEDLAGHLNFPTCT